MERQGGVKMNAKQTSGDLVIKWNIHHLVVVSWVTYLFGVGFGQMQKGQTEKEASLKLFYCDVTKSL